MAFAETSGQSKMLACGAEALRSVAAARATSRPEPDLRYLKVRQATPTMAEAFCTNHDEETPEAQADRQGVSLHLQRALTVTFASDGHARLQSRMVQAACIETSDHTRSYETTRHKRTVQYQEKDTHRRTLTDSTSFSIQKRAARRMKLAAFHQQHLHSTLKGFTQCCPSVLHPARPVVRQPHSTTHSIDLPLSAESPLQGSTCSPPAALRSRRIPKKATPLPSGGAHRSALPTIE